MRKIKNSFLNIVASLALVATAASACNICYFLIYQEELPEGAEKLIRK